MRRVALAAAVLVVVGLFAGFLSLGFSAKPPLPQDVHKDLPASTFASAAAPVTPPPVPAATPAPAPEPTTPPTAAAAH
ncbi:hypothetical protein AA103196_1699 [Ameyamaea chiangmaiensis NBRC 103196]|uniref:Uncharacterized protein n=1 Tax=Ameyamaea chiangmaiensis TaxID=442969 RepID=A0A850P9Q0_9PROT|nr:hypothetical protein [Ameyamaea chiangmaiensis]MBS4074035.1 hypothetical protein [Ameyamaea chiangmaiensis]NVN39409.1 hypothetical protein [Ameyamaea chiangmaiensis]GBQ67496.1 hypothetical protein AA103196_1699 [Ameyamaea chiangmaiensis NBRC 103196]